MDSVLSDIEIRLPRTERECNFVRKSWIKSYALFRPCRVYYASPGVPSKVVPMPNQVYEAAMQRFIAQLLEWGAVRVAASKRDEGVIYGFAAVEDAVEGDEADPSRPALVHYVYVARAFRRFGVARALLYPYSREPATFTSWTLTADFLPIPAKWSYNEVEKWR